MAYIKKKDKAIAFIKDFLKKNGKKVIAQIAGAKEECIIWDDFPICVQDVCADLFALIENEDGCVVFCGTFDDEKNMIASKDAFEKYWRDLSKVDFKHIDYVVKKFESL